MNATNSDWRDDMVRQATAASGRVVSRERARNPLIPDNFLDVSDAGFPSDVHVTAVQIPREGFPGEQQQYRNLVNFGWSHVPWGAISVNGGMDGKANVPAARRVDIGGGDQVASIAGHYLMFADKAAYEARRAENVRRATEHLEYKLTGLEEESDTGRTFASSESSGPMSIDELLDFEQRLGDEAPLEGVRID